MPNVALIYLLSCLGISWLYHLRILVWPSPCCGDGSVLSVLVKPLLILVFNRDLVEVEQSTSSVLITCFNTAIPCHEPKLPDHPLGLDHCAGRDIKYTQCRRCSFAVILALSALLSACFLILFDSPSGSP